MPRSTTIMGHASGPDCAICGTKIKQAQRLTTREDGSKVHAYVSDCKPEQPAVSTSYKPGGPDALTLTVCHSCSRTDRWAKLTGRHYAQNSSGGLCPGPVEQVTYVRQES